jgi:hypothetical protein
MAPKAIQLETGDRPESRNKSAAKVGAVPYYHEIREAFDKRGCPLCRLLAQDASRQLDAVLWEMVNDADVRTELNQARGYCQQHGWLLVRAGAALGVAILMQDVVKTLLDVLASHRLEDGGSSVLQSLMRSLDKHPVSGPAEQLAAALSPQTPCPICSRLQAREASYVKVFLAHLDGPGSLADAYRASDGLCLSHFRQSVAAVSSAADARQLLCAQQAIWERLHGELAEFVRKNDHRFRGEPFGPEKDAWLRALEAISGPPPQAKSERGGLTQSV